MPHGLGRRGPVAVPVQVVEKVLSTVSQLCINLSKISALS